MGWPMNRPYRDGIAINVESSVLLKLLADAELSPVLAAALANDNEQDWFVEEIMVSTGDEPVTICLGRLLTEEVGWQS